MPCSRPADLVRYVSRLLAAERRRRGTPVRSRRLTFRDQAVLGLCWFRDHRFSRATAYRYAAEAVDVLSKPESRACRTRRRKRCGTCASGPTAGTGWIDILVRKPFTGPDWHPDTQKEAIELKVRRAKDSGPSSRASTSSIAT